MVQVRVLEGTEGQGNLLDVYRHIDLPVVPVLVEMESTGVLIDTVLLEHLLELIEPRLHELEAMLAFAAGGAFVNLNSPVQVAGLLYDRLKLPTHKKLGRSTAKEALEPLRRLHPAVAWLLEHRKLVKLKTTYVHKILRLIAGSRDGRLRAHFNNVLVETGRLSSSDPINFQNIPKRVAPGTAPFVEKIVKGIRSAFVAPPGHTIVKFDQAAVEFRILACLADEQSVLAAILDGQDMHIATACDYLTCAYADFESACKKVGLKPALVREMAKTVNYGTAYGQTEKGLFEWGIANGFPMRDEADARRIQDAILGSKPNIVDWIAEQRLFIKRHGYAETYFGRRVWYPDVKDPRRWVVDAALRQGVNAVIQGTAADIMKIAMARIWKEIRRRGLKTRAILAVHDEFVLECPDEEVAEVENIIQSIAPSIVDWQIPLAIELGRGPSWGAAA